MGSSHINNLRATVATVSLILFISGSMSSWGSPVLIKLQSSGDENPLSKPLTVEETSWIASALAVGNIIGPALATFSIVKLGRKPTLFLVAIPFLIAFTTFAFATNVIYFYVARFIAGLSYGACMILTPIYLTEVSQKTNRGKLGSLSKTFGVAGTLLPFAVGPHLSVMWFNLFLLLPILTFLVLYNFFVHETPQYLIPRGREEEAKAVLKKLHGDCGEKDYEEIKSIILTDTSISLKTALKSRYNVKAFLITIGLFSLTRLDGANVILTYTEIIMDKGQASLPANISALIVGVAQFVGSCVTPFFIDRCGRKVFLIASAAGMVIASTLLGVYFYYDDIDGAHWLPIFCLVLHMFSYTLGAASVPSILMTELLPTNLRAKACFIAITCGALMAFAMMKLFPHVSAGFGMHGAFWFFAATNLLMIVFTLLFVPETKGKSFSELEIILGT